MAIMTRWHMPPGQFMRIGAGDPTRPEDTHRLSISMASDIASSRPQPCCKEKTRGFAICWDSGREGVFG